MMKIRDMGVAWVVETLEDLREQLERSTTCSR
jgi:hypothetical protein